MNQNFYKLKYEESLSQLEDLKETCDKKFLPYINNIIESTEFDVRITSLIIRILNKNGIKIKDYVTKIDEKELLEGDIFLIINKNTNQILIRTYENFSLNHSNINTLINLEKDEIYINNIEELDNKLKQEHISNMESFNKIWNFYYGENIDENIFNALDKNIYGTDKLFTREYLFKNKLVQTCSQLIKILITSNSYTKELYIDLMNQDKKSKVFNRDLYIYIEAGKKKTKLLTNENAIFMLKYIFSMRYSFEDTLIELFPYLKKSQVIYLIDILKKNKLIETKKVVENGLIVIVPSNKLDNIILETNKTNKNTISISTLEKHRSKNNYILNKIEDIKEVSDLYRLMKQIPTTFFYKGAENLLLSISEKDNKSRYRFEYDYYKLEDIRNHVQGYISKFKNGSDEEATDKINNFYQPLLQNINFVIDKCEMAIKSFGKFNDYASISLRSLVLRGVFIYNINVFEKDNDISQNFSLLIVQTNQNYKSGMLINNIRDIVIYLSTNIYENKTYADKVEIAFYDEATKQKFLKQMSSIKKRIRTNKRYYNFITRYDLAKCIAKNLRI